jgi:pimeloyl-ACP methyl ester carboxylesterase
MTLVFPLQRSRHAQPCARDGHRSSQSILAADARACILDDAGHMPHIDQPDRWLRAVEDFLE